MLAKIGSFAKATATGNQAITGVGFQPKFVLLFWTHGVTSNTWVGGAAWGMGMCDSGGRYTCYSTHPDAGTARERRAAVQAISICNSAGTVLAEATMSSLDSDGFTLNWTTADATTYLIGYLCLGGTDLTNVDTYEWRPDVAGNTGNKSFTGLAFQPDACLVNCIAKDAAAPVSDSQFVGMIGGFRTTTERAVAMAKTGGSPSASAFNNTRLCADINEADSSDYWYADLVSLDASGFTINLVNNTWGQYLTGAAFKGGSFKVGSFTKATSATTQSVTGIGFAPSAVILFGSHQTSATGESITKARLQLGLIDVHGNNRAMNTYKQDAANVGGNVFSADKAFIVADNDTSTVDGQCTGSLKSDGFDLVWSSNNANADYIGYIAFGPNAAPTFASGPSVSYPNGSFTSPSSTPWTLNFTPSDAESKGTNALTYDVRTAPGGGGSSVGSGTCTSDVAAAPTFAYTTTAIGITTLYLRISDGVNTTEQSFNVDRRSPGGVIAAPQRHTYRAMMARAS